MRSEILAIWIGSASFVLVEAAMLDEKERSAIARMAMRRAVVFTNPPYDQLVWPNLEGALCRRCDWHHHFPTRECGSRLSFLDRSAVQT